MRTKFLHHSSWIFFLSVMCSFASLRGLEEEAAIRKQSATYAVAFNSKDSKGLTALWADDGLYIDPVTGASMKGKKEIGEAYQNKFKEQKEARIELRINSISFPKGNEAVEMGRALLTRPGMEADLSLYKATYRKMNGTWLLTEVREMDMLPPPHENEHLKELQWLIGDWIDQDEDTKIETKITWDQYKNFLTQHFTVTVEGTLVLEGKQIIGWDPVTAKIRSWVFDSDGGFGEGVWHKEPNTNTWVVESKQTLDDGRQASAINIYTPLNQSSYKWESTGREVGGELLPNLEPVTVERKRG